MTAFLVSTAVLMLLVGIVLSPLGLVWSLNVLFGLGIAYSFKTWLAALLLLLFVGGIKPTAESK